MVIFHSYVKFHRVRSIQHPTIVDLPMKDVVFQSSYASLLQRKGYRMVMCRAKAKIDRLMDFDLEEQLAGLTRNIIRITPRGYWVILVTKFIDYIDYIIYIYIYIDYLIILSNRKKMQLIFLIIPKIYKSWYRISY